MLTVRGEKGPSATSRTRIRTGTWWKAALTCSAEQDRVQSMNEDNGRSYGCRLGGAVSLGHELGNGRLRDRKAEPEQFALNPRRTPKHILNAHLPDQWPQTRIDWRPASQVPRFPTPIATETRAMPAHQRLGPDG